VEQGPDEVTTTDDPDERARRLEELTDKPLSEGDDDDGEGSDA
jgi:hypothetical protein